MKTRKQRGFTLIEMMVVVAIIGVLAGFLVVFLRPKVRAIDAANRVGDLVREGSQKAVSLGPVRSDVAIYLASKARTRIIGYGSSTSLTFELSKLVEASVPANSQWVSIKSYKVANAVTAQGWASGVGSSTTLAPLTTTWGSSNADTTSFLVKCYPDGTCDGKTVFFQAVKSDGVDYQARLSIMPLGGATYMRPDWN